MEMRRLSEQVAAVNRDRDL